VQFVSESESDLGRNCFGKFNCGSAAASDLLHPSARHVSSLHPVVRHFRPLAYRLNSSLLAQRSSDDTGITSDGNHLHVHSRSSNVMKACRIF